MPDEKINQFTSVCGSHICGYCGVSIKSQEPHCCKEMMNSIAFKDIPGLKVKSEKEVERQIRTTILPRDRYNRDPMFKRLVDILCQQLIECQYTPTELREAVILAATRHEELYKLIQNGG